MILAAVLFVLGIGLSAFFSGTETGYYRATRARLTMDAVGGSLISRGLIWLANNPVMFVATVLVGNNLANYVVSEAIVRGAQAVFGSDRSIVNLMATILFAPFIFVYGELLPKELYFRAPNRMLKGGGAFFLICCVIFLPVTAVLWVLGRLLAFLIGVAPEKLQASIARYELQQLLDEGHDAGVLKPAQRELAQTMFTMANRPVESFCIPITRLASVRLGTKSEEVFRISDRNRSSEMLVTEKNGRRLLGYVRVLDLFADKSESVGTFRPLIEIGKSEPSVSVLLKMQNQRESLARVVDDQGKTTGLISLETLSSAAWNGVH